MIVCIDVDYKDNGAVAACIIFENWDDQEPFEEFVVKIEEVAEYIPGQFYLRELPCLLAALNKVRYPVDTIVIDGYVTLGSSAEPGLGEHLSKAADNKIPIIGVAKSAFKDTPAVNEVYRGESRKPLYVTAKGLELETAKNNIKKMHGENRIPALLKYVDRLCRKPHTVRQHI